MESDMRGGIITMFSGMLIIVLFSFIVPALFKSDKGEQTASESSGFTIIETEKNTNGVWLKPGSAEKNEKGVTVLTETPFEKTKTTVKKATEEKEQTENENAGTVADAMDELANGPLMGFMKTIGMICGAILCICGIYKVAASLMRFGH